MPINKDALKRYQIIDKLLSDPNHNYTTESILKQVNWECEHVSLRMIQKDIKNIQEYFDKDMIRNAGGRGTVKYADQSEPLFYKELTEDEENLLREVLKTLGQFDGLDNFVWLDLMRKKLDVKSPDSDIPYISFCSNNSLQVPETLLGRLFTAISQKKVIRLSYRKFGSEPILYTVYPYQLKQYNNRWYLLCTRLSEGEYTYNEDKIMNLPLDRMGENFDYVEEEPFIETPVNLKERFDEIIGVTLNQDNPVDDIVFAVSPHRLPYVRTKWLHNSQIELLPEYQEEYRKKYPTLKEYTFFSISCRENFELYSTFASYLDDVILVESDLGKGHMRNVLKVKIERAANIYRNL